MRGEDRPAVAETAFLTANIAHRVGTFDLRVNFSLYAPWTVLFGPSGAGKSTILRVLAGLMYPGKGLVTLQNSIVLDTHRSINISAGKRGIGFVTQQLALFPHMSVYRNVAFGLHTLDRNQRERRVTEMLRLFRIEELSARRPGKLSGGERQRVALARALAPEPKFLLLDEPFSGLDAELKEAILADLTSWLAERNVPALYVSHDVAEAYQTAAQVIVIEDGKIEKQGPVQEVLASRREQLLRQLEIFSQPIPAPAPAESQTSPRRPQ
jgi:ABC-type sulfate/molybdate transport systems ATPase subunit